MRQLNLYYLIIIVFLLSSGATCRKDQYCPAGSHSTIEIRNNSGKVVNWIKNNDANDTVWIVNGTYPTEDRNLISPNFSDQNNITAPPCWESYYRDFSEYYFIFDQDTIRAIGWEGVNGTNRGLLKRIRVDLSYLQTNNFTITYP